MAEILRGKFKGREVKLEQWCNDWFSVEGEGFQILAQHSIFSPTNLKFTTAEMLKVLHHKHNGYMFSYFKFVPFSKDTAFYKMIRV